MTKKQKINGQTKQTKQTEQAEQATLEDNREHVQALGQPWAVLLGNPKDLLPQVLGTVLKAGATRPSWHWQKDGAETLLMAWPKDEPLRAGVVLKKGKNDEDKHETASVMPILEGYNNDFEVHSVVPWKSDVEAHVAVTVIEGQNPLWFYNPLYFRDKADLTPGVMHTFVLAGLAFGVRRALLDEITITQGPVYEAHAQKWLEDHPGKSRLDVPTLKVNLAGKHLIRPGRVFGEYEARGIIIEVDSCMLDKLEITMLRLDFPMPERAPLHIMLYVPKPLLGDYIPEEGHEIDTYMWLQGRIMDMDSE